MASQLQDGQALTVEWLNSLVLEINQLSKKIETGDSRRKVVAWTGNLIPSSTNVIEVESGTKTALAVTKGKALTAKIDFKSPFANDSVNIVCTVDVPSGTKGIPVTVTAVTSKNFTVVIGDTTNIAQKVNLRYIAIGKSKE
jgi:hypothetical protein